MKNNSCRSNWHLANHAQRTVRIDFTLEQRVDLREVEAKVKADIAKTKAR